MDSAKKKKIIIISSSIAGAIVIIAGGIAAYIALRPVKIPDPQKDPNAARELLSSKDFNKLTHQQQNDFVRSFRPRRRPTRAEMDAARKQMQQMSPEERRNMRDNMRKVFMRQQEERLDNFFKMSKAEQLAELDRRIAERDKRRKEMEQRRAQRRQNQQARNQNNQNNQNNDQQATQQNNQNQQNAQAGQTAQNNNQNNNRRRGPSAQMRREFESNMSPSLRSKMQQYRRLERLRREGKLK